MSSQETSAIAVCASGPADLEALVQAVRGAGSWSIVPIQYSVGTTLAKTRTSPSRLMSVQNACGLLPGCSYKLLRASTSAIGSPTPS